MDSCSLQGSGINKVIITEENSPTHWNHTGKLGKTVTIGHSGFVFGASSQPLRVSWNFFNSKHGGLQINTSTLPSMFTPHNTKNEDQLSSLPHTLFSVSLLELWPALPASGESNFVRTQQLCFCYSLQFGAKQTLFCYRQPLLEYDTKIWFRIFLFMQWLTENSIIEIH